MRSLAQFNLILLLVALAIGLFTARWIRRGAETPKDIANE